MCVCVCVTLHIDISINKVGDGRENYPIVAVNTPISGDPIFSQGAYSFFFLDNQGQIRN